MPAQARPPRRVDVHCHCLPALDDGPATAADALVLCRRLAADGITEVVATPHQLGRYDGRNTNAEIRSAVSDLNEAVAGDGLSLRVWPGADIRIDERIPDLLARDEVMTVADGGRYLLLELPRETLISPVGLARELASMGITAILTHPERCPQLSANPDRVLPWLEEGICLQLTAASILGAFGPSAEKACWYWLGGRVASLVATDAHDGTGRRPCMSQAFAAISRRLGRAAARRVCVTGPQHVLRAESIPPAATTSHAEAPAWT